MVISKNCKISSEIKFEIENVEYVRQKLWVENLEYGLITAIKKAWLLNGWVDEWMGGIKLKYNGGPFSKMVRFL